MQEGFKVATGGGTMGCMALPAAKHGVTVQEYLQLEEHAEARHEFHEGEMLAMSGGTYNHSLVTMNLGAALHRSLRGSRCRALDSNMRVRISGTLSYVYPDISIVCGGPVFDIEDSKQTTITNPSVVIEVLSESTESYDRGGKFNLYRGVESLNEYVLVSQQRPLVETFIRQEDGMWLFTEYQGIESSFSIRSLHIAVPIAEIYEGVEFDPPSPAIGI